MLHAQQLAFMSVASRTQTLEGLELYGLEVMYSYVSNIPPLVTQTSECRQLTKLGVLVCLAVNICCEHSGTEIRLGFFMGTRCPTAHVLTYICL